MSVELFGYTEDGMTPMSRVNIALASCVTMCLQSYFSNYQEIEELAIQVDSNYEEGRFTLVIHLPKDMILENEQELLASVDNFCRVKKLFREDIKIDISLAKLAYYPL